MHFIHTKTSLQMRIIEREQRTAEQMIRIYCRYKEGNKELCPTCRQLLQYAHNRLKHCTFGEQKKTCRNCPIHCYKPEMKKRIQEVMRYAGPRMFFFSSHNNYQAFHSSINRMDRAQFYKEVYSITKEIPYGNVFTYGKIAQLIGNPQYVTRNFAASLFRNIKYFTLRKLYLCRKWMQKRLQKTTTTGITLPNFDFLA